MPSVGTVAEAKAEWEKRREEAMANAKHVDRTSLGWFEDPKTVRARQIRMVEQHYGPYERSLFLKAASQAAAKRRKLSKDPKKVAEMERQRTKAPRA
jgi:hypothetical protein